MVAESMGAFAIVFFGCGAIAVGGSSVGVNLAFGLVVAAMIYALGAISGAHFNPAVTVALALSKRFAWRGVPWYVGAQIIGACAASATHLALFAPATFGATRPHIAPVAAILAEAVGTFFLMIVILGTTSRAKDTPLAGAAIGAVVTFSGLVLGPLTGNSLNPARSIGPALFEPAALPALPLYFVGPLLGAAAAAAAFSVMTSSHLEPAIDQS